MEQVYDKLLEYGVLGIFLVAVIWYFLKKEKELKEEMKEKSIAHAQSMKEKDEMIQSLNSKIHEMGISAVSTMKEWINALRDLK